MKFNAENGSIEENYLGKKERRKEKGIKS